MRISSTLLFLSALVTTSACFSKPSSNEVFDESATMAYASRNALLFWPTSHIEKELRNFSQKPIGKIKIADTNTARLVSIPLESIKIDETISLLLTGMNSGIFYFFSKERGMSKAPSLKISTVSGKSYEFAAKIDLYVQRGVRKSLGTQKIVQIGNGRFGIVSFQIPQEIITNSASIQNWQLTLQLTEKQFGATKLHVSQLELLPNKPSPELKGLAKLYPNDIQIDSHSSVYFADNFNNISWFNNVKAKFGVTELPWGKVEISTISHQDVSHFLDEKGSTAIATFRTDRNLALNLEYPFAKKVGFEPEEAYFRYYLKLSAGAKVGGGGKLPGFSGTYNTAGWGGRGNTGKNGWSARGGFFHSVSNKNSPWAGRLPIGNYIYEVGKDKYGKTFPWGHELSTLEPGRWYCIEQHLKLNTPGQSNGLLEVWVDGAKIYQKADLHLRDTKKLKIEKVWFNFYFGGVAKPRRDFDMYIDNIVIAADYIGPVSPI